MKLQKRLSVIASVAVHAVGNEVAAATGAMGSAAAFKTISSETRGAMMVVVVVELSAMAGIADVVVFIDSEAIRLVLFPHRILF